LVHVAMSQDTGHRDIGKLGCRTQDAALSGFGGIQPAAAVGAHFMTM